MIKDVFISDEEIQRQYAIAAELKCSGGVYVNTFGCQQNEADSERIYGMAELMGYRKVDKPEDAALIVFNTCAIREHAELKALSKAGGLKKLKEKNPAILTAVCGCMAEQAHRREQILRSYPYIDFMFGTDKLWMLPEMVANAKAKKKYRIYVNDKPHDSFGSIAEGLPVVREGKYRAWVSIMYGCNNFCSYCVVPHVRGRERSRRSEDVLVEVESLVKAGYKDITLLGQNVNSYKGTYTFPELLRRAASFDGEYWVRFMTSHPKDASKELVDVIAENPKIAPHFHLPMQSGDNRVLELMNRRYTVEQYKEKAAYIKERVPNVALSSDIICGFPTETEAEFDNTVKAVEEIGFDMLFTFVYSPRLGTPAAQMEQIPHEVKTARFARLSAAENLKAESLCQRFVGTTVRVLSDGETENGIYSGRTGQNKIISFTLPSGFDPAKAAAGNFLDVKVTSAQAYTLSGEALRGTL